MPELDLTKRWLTWTVHATPLMTLTTDLGLSVRVSMLEYVRLVTATSFGSDHCPGRYQVFSRTFPHNFAKSDTKFFSLKSDKDSGCSSGICGPSTTLSRPKNRKKLFFLRSDKYVRSWGKKLVPPWTVIRIMELGEV